MSTIAWSRVALTFGEDAGVAQMAERLLCKQQVTGSIPVGGSVLRIRKLQRQPVLTPTLTPTPTTLWLCDWRQDHLIERPITTNSHEQRSLVVG